MTLYIDAFLGTLAGFVMAYPLMNRKRDVLSLLTFFGGLNMLVLSKDAGLLFAAVAALTFAVYTLCDHEAASLPKRLGMSAGAVAVPLLAHFSWACLQADGPLSAGSDSGLSNVARVLLGSEAGDDYRRDIITRFFDSLFHAEITVGGGNTSLRVSYGLVLAALLLAVLLWIGRFEKGRLAKRPGKIAAIGCLITALFYTLGMCYMYMFIFSYEEGRRLLQMNRYMGILALMLLSLLVFCLLERLPRRLKTKQAALLLAGLLLIVPHYELYSFVSRRNVSVSYAMRWIYNDYAQSIKASVSQPDASVYAICRDHFDNWFMRLCVRPLHMEQYGDMRDYAYVWLCHPPEDFATEYGALFETPEDIGEHRLYQWTEAGKLRYIPFPA